MELLQGTLDLLILKAVVLEPQHGWVISERLHQISSASLQIVGKTSTKSPCPCGTKLTRLAEQSGSTVKHAAPVMISASAPPSRFPDVDGTRREGDA